jgi:hypothetical protein
MTYTFKLARRLAVSRNLIMLPVLLMLAACNGDATAPEGPTESPTTGSEVHTQDLIPVAVQVSPHRVTLETNQLIQFRAHGRTSAGDSVAASVSWSTSGGTVLPDGRFSAAAIGTYTVAGVSRVRGKQQVDTSFVTVVRRNTNLVAIKVSPTSVTLTPGVSQTFTAVGRVKGGGLAPIGVNWGATGGSIDGGGTYVAGDTAGTYRVTATNTSGTLADTVQVTISAPPTLPPPPAPVPPAEPVLATVTLKPGSMTLAPGATKQFATYGLTTTGDSVAVAVEFKATGGTVTSTGLYTAGTTPGSFRLIATSGALADTSGITITSPLGSGTPVGLPFGPAAQLAKAGGILTPFSMTADGGYTPGNIISRINTARAGGYKLMIQMPGGSHSDETSPLLSVINGVLQFDEGKWRAIVDQFNTPEIRQAIADGVRDGVIIGDMIMDEPQVTGMGDGNTWGPPGTMTKLRVDGLCQYIRDRFPTLPAGPFHQHNTFEPTKSYRVCDFIVDSYNHKRGDVYTFRDDGLALARRDGHAIMFSMNILNGGVQDKDGVWDCTGPGQGGKGNHEPNCRMTADSMRAWGNILGKADCGLYMWTYNAEFVNAPQNMEAFRDVAATLAAQPYKSCSR